MLSGIDSGTPIDRVIEDTRGPARSRWHPAERASISVLIEN